MTSLAMLLAAAGGVVLYALVRRADRRAAGDPPPAWWVVWSARLKRLIRRDSDSDSDSEPAPPDTEWILKVRADGETFYAPGGRGRPIRRAGTNEPTLANVIKLRPASVPGAKNPKPVPPVELDRWIVESLNNNARYSVIVKEGMRIFGVSESTMARRIRHWRARAS